MIKIIKRAYILGWLYKRQLKSYVDPDYIPVQLSFLRHEG